MSFEYCYEVSCNNYKLRKEQDMIIEYLFKSAKGYEKAVLKRLLQNWFDYICKNYLD